MTPWWVSIVTAVIGSLAPFVTVLLTRQKQRAVARTQLRSDLSLILRELQENASVISYVIVLGLDDQAFQTRQFDIKAGELSRALHEPRLLRAIGQVYAQMKRLGRTLNQGSAADPVARAQLEDLRAEISTCAREIEQYVRRLGSPLDIWNDSGGAGFLVTPQLIEANVPNRLRPRIQLRLRDLTSALEEGSAIVVQFDPDAVETWRTDPGTWNRVIAPEDVFYPLVCAALDHDVFEFVADDRFRVLLALPGGWPGPLVLDIICLPEMRIAGPVLPGAVERARARLEDWEHSGRPDPYLL